MAQVYQETAGKPLSKESTGALAGVRNTINDEPGNNRTVDAPMSAEEFERQHPAMLGAVQNVVHREMKLSSMNDKRHISGDIQRLLNLQLVVTYIPLVLGYALHGISQRDQRSLSVSKLRGLPGILRRVNRISLHSLTSLLCVGALIVSIGHRTKQPTFAKEEQG
ncbi:hypothetical protein [Bifidobacterium sp. ESL0825]|uniref:hypothetical protein n=1 Tax=Bifidobacterium sp. ESL0825 TaxID=3448587 RepID=UPI004042AEDC